MPLTLQRQCPDPTDGGARRSAAYPCTTSGRRGRLWRSAPVSFSGPRFDAMKLLQLSATLLLLTAPGLADTVTLTSTADNSIYASNTSAALGAGSTVFVGVVGNGGVTRGLVRFDAASQIPAGSTINSVSLRLNVAGAAQFSGPMTTVDVHRVTSDWGEGTSTPFQGGGTGGAATTDSSTWINTFFPGSNWTTAGGDFVAAPSATLSVGTSGMATFADAGLVADVQAWVDGGAGDFGWLLKDAVESGASARRFSARESSSDPELVIDFTPPGVGTVFCMTSANSTGAPASLTALGSATVADNDLTLVAADMPANQFGIFITSLTQNPSMTSNLCLGGSIGRFVMPGQIVNSGMAGTFSLSVDLGGVPQGAGLVPVMAGETRNFQGWFRDSIAPGSGFTDGIAVTFM